MAVKHKAVIPKTQVRTTWLSMINNSQITWKVLSLILDLFERLDTEGLSRAINPMATSVHGRLLFNRFQ